MLTIEGRLKQIVHRFFKVTDEHGTFCLLFTLLYIRHLLVTSLVALVWIWIYGLSLLIAVM